MNQRSAPLLAIATLPLLLAGCPGGGSGTPSETPSVTPLTITTESGETLLAVELSSGSYTLSLEQADVICEGYPTQRGGLNIENATLVRNGDTIVVRSGTTGETIAMGEVNDDMTFRLSFDLTFTDSTGNGKLEGVATDQGLLGIAKVVFTLADGTGCYTVTHFSGTEV